MFFSFLELRAMGFCEILNFQDLTWKDLTYQRETLHRLYHLDIRFKLQ